MRLMLSLLGAMNNIWNDFDSTGFRDHVFAYPTMDGVIDTIQWEGWREGVDDVRYVTTLLEAIEKAKKSRDGKIREKALTAEKYLDGLDIYRNLDTIRLEMITCILELTGSR